MRAAIEALARGRYGASRFLSAGRARFVAALVFLLASAAFSSGCIAYVRPHAEWAEPVGLDLDQTALNGVRIKVDCSLANDDGQPTPSDDSECAKLRVTIGETGARILLDEIPPEAVPTPETPKKSADELSKAEQQKQERLARERQLRREKFPRVIGDAKTEPADFRVSWVSYPTASDHCGKTILLLLFFGMGPCLEDIDARSVMTVTNVAKGTQIQKKLDLRIRRVLGAASLPLLLIDMSRPVGRREYRREAGDHLLEFIQNTVYTFAMRERLEAERPGEPHT